MTSHLAVSMASGASLTARMASTSQTIAPLASLTAGPTLTSSADAPASTWRLARS